MSNRGISIVFAAGLLFLMAVLPEVSSAGGWQWVSPQGLFSLMKEGSGLWLVDVRSEAEFAERHVEGAIHIPAALLATKHLPKGKAVVLVDDSLGLKRGQEAAEVLRKKGVEQVYLLEGGLLGWAEERYPMAGKGNGPLFRSVMPEELAWAREHKIPAKILDLREKEEREQGPVPQAEVVEGKDLAERLEKVKKTMKKTGKGLAAKLDAPLTTILVFPISEDPRMCLQRSFYGIARDIRYLEGGYAAWAAKPDKTINTVGACPTCSGGTSGGKR